MDEQSVRMWQLWPSVVQAVMAVVLVGITAWYAHLTSRLARLQVEPSVDVIVTGPPLAKEEVTIANDGPDPILNVSLRISNAVISNNTVQRRTRHQPWKVERIGAGESVVRPLDEVAERAAQEREAFFKDSAANGLATPRGPVAAALRLEIRYEREVDRKKYVVRRVFAVARSGHATETGTTWTRLILEPDSFDDETLRRMLEKLRDRAD
jgi:hypothetical protein